MDITIGDIKFKEDWYSCKKDFLLTDMEYNKLIYLIYYHFSNAEPNLFVSLVKETRLDGFQLLKLLYILKKDYGVISESPAIFIRRISTIINKGVEVELIASTYGEFVIKNHQVELNPNEF